MSERFRSVPARQRPAAREAEVLARWVQLNPFAATQAADGRADYVFYEGPPTANGKPQVSTQVMDASSKS